MMSAYEKYEYIRDIMELGEKHDVQNSKDFTKYESPQFEIIVKNSSVVIVDKRFATPKVFHDLKMAHTFLKKNINT